MINKSLVIMGLLANTAFSQINVSNAIQFKGYQDGIRTVHFSSDEQYVYGDFSDLVKWSILDQEIVSSTPIPGYSISKSSFDGDSLWIAANSNYNTAKKDISDMHDNLNVWNGTQMMSKKMSEGYQSIALIPNTNKAVVIGMDDKYHYFVAVLNLFSGKQERLLFSEGKDGSAVPTAVKVNTNGDYVAVSLAGAGAGMRVYNLSDGKELSFVSDKKDANDIAISSDNKSIYFNTGNTLIAANSENWAYTKKWELSDNITSLDVGPTGRYVAVAFQKKGAVLFDTKTGSVIKELTQGRVFDITFSYTGKYLGLGLQKTIQSDQLASLLLFKILDY